MLLINSTSLLFPPMEPFSGKYSTKTKLLRAANHPKMNAFRRKIDDNFSFFNFGCHSPAKELTAMAATAGAAVVDPQHVRTEIGILDFFKGKNIFITGATGLLGKVIVEKLLRSTSVDRVYVLIKAQDKEAAFHRLNREIIRSELFRSLKEKYGKSYEGIVREKLIAVAGNICEPNMGMDYESIDAIRENVHVIIQSAASTTFHDRYDLLFDTNVIAPQRVMRFGKSCKKLQLFTHISTAYVNERVDGIVMEKPLNMEESKGTNIGDEISLLLKSPSLLSDYDATTFFKTLGQQRAEKFGYSTTYQLSKGMGEMALNEIRGDIPLLIMRPAIIESCYHQPLPGWIQGIRMFDPVAISYGKGLFPGLLADPQLPLDIIPVDLVANTTIAAIAKHGNNRQVGGAVTQPNVYHSASAVSNPLTYFQAFENLHHCFKTAPLIRGAHISKIKFFNDFNQFSKFTRHQILQNYAKGSVDTDEENRTNMVRQCNAKALYAQQLGKLYEFATFSKTRYHTGNTDKLIEEMSKEEESEFEVDIRNIDWKKYLQEIHVQGLVKYAMNGQRPTAN